MHGGRRPVRFVGRHQGIEGRGFQVAVRHHPGAAPDDHAVVKLMKVAPPALRVKAQVEVGQGNIHLKTDPVLAGDIVQLLSLQGTVKIDTRIGVYVIDRRDVGVAVRAQRGHSANGGG